MKDGNTSPVLVIGGGVAGISAALDLAGTGLPVHLVERSHCLGGQVMKLDKLYPTDHCAFCPVWTDIKRLRSHPLIAIHSCTEVRDLRRIENHHTATLVRKPPAIDERLCVFCGKCARECPLNAIHPLGEHSYPPSYRINDNACNKCEACVKVCPTAAIDVQRADEAFELAVDHVVWASGFEEVDLSPREEFGFGTHPDIMTSLEFEEWTAEAGINKGDIIKKSNRSAPHNIAFIQCAGARDQKMLSYCSAVCCMHAFKQAQWVKRRNHAVHCVVFYTDLRTVGRDYYEYSLRDSGGIGVRCVRGRPSLIYPLPGGNGIAVKFENTMTRKREIWKFDMVILNGNIRPALAGTDKGDIYTPALTKEGFVMPESNDISRFSCGFSREPADVAETVIQASSAAVRTILAKRNR